MQYEKSLQPQLDITQITNNYLEAKLLKHFNKSIKFISKQKIVIVRKDCNLLDDDLAKLEEYNLIDRVALIFAKYYCFKYSKIKITIKD